ncbi:hypothetical protein ADICEAN_01932 [Cesiribacter andamanensis AMV16]|uniref:Uncharacterized protein n=1 Tax=Cesiribacter andamanensis AMV16 TaxID=1279009 RepID=M7NWX0_9BACT|nr:hypothetical protein ADICEAN_01932 [Cesiribacter andamanensis AMV16]
MGLWALVGRVALPQGAGNGLYIVMSLCRAINAVALVQAGIEPLRRVGSGVLAQQHVHQLVIKRLGIIRTGKVSPALAPAAPAMGQAVHHLPGRAFAAQAAIGLGYPCFSKIFLGQNIGSNLRPGLGHLYPLHVKNGVAGRVADGRAAAGKGEMAVGIGLVFSEIAANAQAFWLGDFGFFHKNSCG